MSERQLFQRVKTTGALQRRHGWAASDVSGTTTQDSPQDSEDGEHCVAGDAAHVAAIPSHPHEAAFSPSDSPAEEWKWKQQTKYIGKKKKLWWICMSFSIWLFFFWPVLDDPVVLATFGAISNQHHCMIQVVGVTVGLFKYSCKATETKHILHVFTSCPSGAASHKLINMGSCWKGIETWWSQREEWTPGSEVWSLTWERYYCPLWHHKGADFHTYSDNWSKKKEGGFYLCSSYSSCSFTRLVCDDMRQYG